MPPSVDTGFSRYHTLPLYLGILVSWWSNGALDSPGGAPNPLHRGIGHDGDGFTEDRKPVITVGIVIIEPVSTALDE